MEETIEGMMGDNWENRTVLKRQFNNLHGAYSESLSYFTSFYETTQVK